jgi:hypothetical protein
MTGVEKYNFCTQIRPLRKREKRWLKGELLDYRENWWLTGRSGGLL